MMHFLYYNSCPALWSIFIDTLSTNFMEETNCMRSEQEEEQQEEQDEDKGERGSKEVKNGKMNYCGSILYI